MRRGATAGGSVARLRPGHDLHQQAADAHAGDGLARDLKTGEQPHENPIEPVLLRRARAARRAEHRAAARGGDQEQIAGIDRHAEMLDATADRLDRGRNHVAPVGDCRSAEHDHQLGALPQHLVDRLGKRALLVRDAPLGDDGGAGGGEALLGDLQGLLDHLARKARQQRGYDPDLANAVGRDPDERPRGLHHGQRGIALTARDREGNDLDRRDHLAGHHGLVGRQRREGDRLVDLVEAIDRRLVDHQHAGALGEQIGAAGEGAVDAHPLARDRRRDLGRGRVLRHVARLDPRHHDLGDAGGLERCDLGLADRGALLEHEAALADRMHRNRAFGLGDRHRAELHAPFSGDCRSRAVISPMIATAISDGETAPMSSPIGAWMRASAASADALRLQALEASPVGLLRAERADIEAVALERMRAARDRRSWGRG